MCTLTDAIIYNLNINFTKNNKITKFKFKKLKYGFVSFQMTVSSVYYWQLER